MGVCLQNQAMLWATTVPAVQADQSEETLAAGANHSHQYHKKCYFPCKQLGLNFA